MIRIFQLSSVFCGLMAFILVIIAVSTTDWLEACVSVYDVLSDKFLPRSSSSLLPPAKNKFITDLTNRIGGSEQCIYVGLLETVVKPPIYQSNSEASAEKDRRQEFLKVAAALLILGLIVTTTGIALVLMSFIAISTNYKKPLYDSGVVASVLLTIGGLLLIGGALAFTIPHSQFVHRPTQFAEDFTNTLNDLNLSFGRMVVDATQPDEVRKRREVFINQTSFSDFSPHQPSDSFASLHKDIYFQSNLALLTQLDPVFGYSLYIAWCAAAAANLAALLSFATLYMVKQKKSQAMTEISLVETTKTETKQ